MITIDGRAGLEMADLLDSYALRLGGRVTDRERLRLELAARRLRDVVAAVRLLSEALGRGGDDMATAGEVTGRDAVAALRARARARDEVMFFLFTDPTTCRPVHVEFLGMDVLDRIESDGLDVNWDGRYLRARFPWGLDVRVHGEPRRRRGAR